MKFHVFLRKLGRALTLQAAVLLLHSSYRHQEASLYHRHHNDNVFQHAIFT